MAKQMVEMTVMVEFDDDRTDAESLSNALDTLMTTALSTPGILDEYGPVEVSQFYPPQEATCDHEPDWSAATPADGAPGIIDVPCKKCGCNGSFGVNPRDVNW